MQFGCMAQKHAYTLDETLELARKNNLQMEKERLGTEGFKELKKSLYTRYFPSASMSATYLEMNSGLFSGLVGNLLTSFPSLYKMTGVESDAQFAKRGVFGGLTFIQPVYTGGLIHNANKFADLMTDVSEAKTQLKMTEVEQEVEKYFWLFAQCYESYCVIDELDSLIKVASHDANLALKAGLVTKSDVMQVDIYASKLKAARLTLEDGKNLCKTYLGHLSGQENYDSIEWDMFDLKEPSSFLVDPKSALEQRTETGLLDKQVQVFQLEKKMVKATLMPKFGVGFSYGMHKFWSYNDNNFWNDNIEKNHSEWTLFGTLSIPISAWWGGYHDIKRANLHIRQAEIDRTDKRGLMALQIDLKWKQMGNAYAQLQIFKSQKDQALQNEKQQASAYRSGVITMMERLEATTLYEKAFIDYVDACVKYRIAISEYMHVTAR